MTAAVRAGAAYALAVFVVGFVLGTLRVLVVAPVTGEVAAVAIEVPIMLLAAALIAPRVAARARIGGARGERATMGAVGLGVLLALEWALAVAVFGRSPAEVVASYGTAAGILGLAGQVGFAFVPLFTSPALAGGAGRGRDRTEAAR
ncbi:MAG: hypothetical protein AB7G21_08015 [Dehalococcoidia bacterium]